MARLSYSARRAIIDTCLAMNRLGINQGTAGNVSVRTKGGCLITPSGADYELLRAGDVIEISLDGEILESRAGGGRVGRPSSEWRMHVDIYAGFPNAQAVVHAHPPYSTALACHRRGIPAFHYMVAVAGGDDIRCADYATFGTAALSENMLRALEGRSACLLANHGMICFGSDLRDALKRAVEVENLAKQYLLSLGIGEPVELDSGQMREVVDRFRGYGKP
jgi:L-fuculose-phosphate aldolase